MKKFRGLIFGMALAAALGALTLYINGCGGGGGGGGSDASTPAASAQGSATSGRVAAAVTLTGRTAGRTAAQTTTTIPVTITISGVYSETGQPFTPIVQTIDVSLEQGYAVARVLEIPIGVNHLIVAEANWGGATEIVKAIIPQVEPGVTTSVNANSRTTAVANIAIAYAGQQGKGLHEISADTLALIDIGVEYLAQNGDYEAVSAEQVIAILNQLAAATAISVSPQSATLVYGATQTFTATLTDSQGQPVFASPTWSVTSAIGIVDSSGAFSASGVGSGEVTARFGTLSASALITVSAVCSADTDCNDGSAATSDTCSNPGTTSAVCSNTPYTCNSNSDCTTSQPVCMNGGTLSAVCVVCISDPDCDDANPDTTDTCANGGTTSATCSNVVNAACFSDTECNDGNAGTIDTCYNPGAITAVCGHSTNVAAGNITANTTWTLAGSPYIVAGQIQVDQGVTLTIEPGVIVQFDYPNAGSNLFGAIDASLSGIRVDGTLNAAGTAASPITFTLSAGSLSYGAGFWGGIYFTSNSTGGALQYANIEYPSYAIMISGSAPAVSNVSITNAAAPEYTGMGRRLYAAAGRIARVQMMSMATISVADITGNFSMSNISISYAPGATGEFDGMSLSYLSGASNSLSNITIDGSLYTALSISEVSNLAITNLAITNSADNGIQAYNITDVSCTNCSVTNAGYYGASFDSFTNLTLSGCAFNSSMGAGLSLYGMNGANTITNCDASFNNSAGLYYYSAVSGSLAITGSRFAQNCATGLYLNSYGYESGISVTNTNVVDNASIGIYGGSSYKASLNGVYLAGNNGAGAGVADTSTATPDSGSSPQQYLGVLSVASPAATAVSGLPSAAGSVTCGYY